VHVTNQSHAEFLLSATAAEKAERSLSGPVELETTRNSLFVIPRRRENGFRASIRGQILDLADPSSGHALAPTPADLFVASIASELAWSARTLLRARGLPDDVSVSATWQTARDQPAPPDIALTVTVSRRAAAICAELAVACDNSLTAATLGEGCVHVSVEMNG
jgi:uncharacterized OsmC-like protein